MKPLFTFLIAALFLVGCGPTGEEHAHDHSHDHDHGHDHGTDHDHDHDHSEETKKLEDEIASLKKAAAEKDAKIKSLERSDSSVD